MPFLAWKHEEFSCKDVNNVTNFLLKYLCEKFIVEKRFDCVLTFKNYLSYVEMIRSQT